MMSTLTNDNEYAPHFRDGLLFLPEKAITLLIEAGVKHEVADRARHGMMLDNREGLAEISAAIEQLLARMRQNSN